MEPSDGAALVAALNHVVVEGTTFAEAVRQHFFVLRAPFGRVGLKWRFRELLGVAIRVVITVARLGGPCRVSSRAAFRSHSTTVRTKRLLLCGMFYD